MLIWLIFAEPVANLLTIDMQSIIHSGYCSSDISINVLILYAFCRTAFFSTRDEECKRTFESALQQTINYPSLKCCGTNTQLSAYLMYKYEEFATKYEGEAKYYVATRHLGL